MTASQGAVERALSFSGLVSGRMRAQILRRNAAWEETDRQTRSLNGPTLGRQHRPSRGSGGVCLPQAGR
jgi:hypothetical protein